MNRLSSLTSTVSKTKEILSGSLFSPRHRFLVSKQQLALSCTLSYQTPEVLSCLAARRSEIKAMPTQERISAPRSFTMCSSLALAASSLASLSSVTPLMQVQYLIHLHTSLLCSLLHIRNTMFDVVLVQCMIINWYQLLSNWIYAILCSQSLLILPHL